MMVMVMVTTMVKVDCNLFLISRGGHSKTGNGYDEDWNKDDDDDDGVGNDDNDDIGDDDDDDIGDDDDDGSTIVTMAVLQWVAIPTFIGNGGHSKTGNGATLNQDDDKEEEDDDYEEEDDYEHGNGNDDTNDDNDERNSGRKSSVKFATNTKTLRMILPWLEKSNGWVF